MRWNCPHCGTSLALRDEILGSGWNFSRCYQCAGYSLVRQPEVNLVKVDQAPAGEKVLLPEATENPQSNSKAKQHLQMARRRNQTRQMVTPTHIQRPASHPPRMEAKGVSIPQHEPIPIEIPKKEHRYLRHLLPVGISLAGTVAITSGIFLFVQGKSIWENAQNSAVKSQGRLQVMSVEDEIKSRAAAPNRKTARQTSRALAEKVDRAMEAAPAADSLVVQTKDAIANLRAGPGLEYPVLNRSEPLKKYQVRDWENRWFNIIVSQTPFRTAWIRNDMVNVLTQD